MKRALVLIFMTASSFLRAESVKMLFVGDINFTGRIAAAIDKNGIAWPFQGVKPVLEKFDFRVANLESPAGLGGAEYCPKRVYFKANPKHLDALANADFNLVSLANNHALDYGQKVLAQTQAELAQRDILSMGIVKNSSEDSQLVIQEIKGIKFGFLAYCNACPSEFAPGENTPGVAVGTVSRVTREIAALKPRVDFVIVVPHWGDEYHGYNSNQSFLAKKMLEAGADVIVGSHPHVLQKIEQRKGGVVAYSLGNFLFPMRWQTSMDSAMMFVKFDKANHSIEYSFLPVSLDSNRPIVVKDGSREDRDIFILNKGYEYRGGVRTWLEKHPWGLK